MKKEALNQFNNPDLVLLAFILFFISFLGLVIWAYRRQAKVHYARMARLPLEKQGGSHER